MRTYYVPDITHNALHGLTDAVFTVTWWGTYYHYPHFIDEETGAQRVKELAQDCIANK